MKAFREDSPCPKCGNREATTAYKTYGDKDSLGRRPDHLTRMCQRCGYHWDEACLDSTESGREYRH